ncbi:MAG: MBL fold metallo-hydrolase [Holosporales bacterium]|jgi:phosphoribosyl 1,2-cyclic phosphate phosphodiesterase|nr:MBL fold metallo-hydrolase [Holosporales bacterium]
MSEKTIIKILGCGSSGGIPDVAFGWGACDSKNPKNYRTRSSILIQTANINLLVDTSPDLRHQLLSAEVSRIDAVFLTHMHADHTHGINELRRISQAYNKVIPVYGDFATISDVIKRFNYLFDPDPKNKHWYSTCLSGIVMKDNPADICGISCTWIVQDHGPCNTLGLRVGNFAYTIEMKDMPPENIEVLRGVDLWIVECLEMGVNPTHTGLQQVLQWAEKIKPSRVILTNMGLKIDYDTLSKVLPSHITPAYDGLTIELY